MVKEQLLGGIIVERDGLAQFLQKMQTDIHTLFSDEFHTMDWFIHIPLPNFCLRIRLKFKEILELLNLHITLGY